MPRGRPKGSLSAKNKSGLKEIKFDEKSITKLRSINASDEDIHRFEYPFLCSCCGRRFKKQATNFSYSQSPIFNGNNHYLNVCCSCVDNMLEQYTAMLGSQDEAIKRICMKFDIYFNEQILGSVKKEDASRSRIKTYIRQINLQQHAGKTYDTYLAEQQGDAIDTIEDMQNLALEGERITKAMFDRWQGVSKDDMIFLEEHYKMLKKQNPNVDSNGEIFIRDLCTTKLLQTKAIKANDIANYDKLTKLYRDSFQAAGLKTVQEEDKSNDNPLGVNAAIIAQYTPEEFYKDKTLFKDFDGIGEYLERHVYRPLRNLEFNDNKQDPDFNIGEENEDE